MRRPQTTAYMCPKCRGTDVAVIDSRRGKTDLVRRRRACNGCGCRFTTYEYTEEQFIAAATVLADKITEGVFEEIVKHALEHLHESRKRDGRDGPPASP